MQNQTIVLVGLLAFTLVLFVRNAVELVAVYRLSLRVERRAYQVAALCGFVSGLNSEVVSLAKEKEIPIIFGDVEPPYLKFIKSRAHRRRGRKGRRSSQTESRT